jgi:outer membrane lipase/esterase
MTPRLNTILGIVLLALTLLVSVNPALADLPPQRFVVFGDSLSDPGNAFALIHKFKLSPFKSLIPNAPYAHGLLHFSNGPTWIEQLSWRMKAMPSAGPAILLPTIMTNYAIGGARARRSDKINLSVQVGLFLKNFNGKGPSHALYVVWLGGNDLYDALQALEKDPTSAASDWILQQAVLSIRDNLIALYGAGARKFLIPNAPDIGLMPAIRLRGPAAQDAACLLSTQFNSQLKHILQEIRENQDIEIVELDVFNILYQTVAAPADVGLTNVTQPCIRLNFLGSNAFCNRPSRFLFWDGIHPTVAGHRILAYHAHEALKNSPKSAQAQ